MNFEQGKRYVVRKITADWKDLREIRILQILEKTIKVEFDKTYGFWDRSGIGWYDINQFTLEYEIVEEIPTTTTTPYSTGII